MTAPRLVIAAALALLAACVLLALAGAFHSSLLAGAGLVAMLLGSVIWAIWRYWGTDGRRFALWGWVIVGAIILSFLLRELS